MYLIMPVHCTDLWYIHFRYIYSISESIAIVKYFLSIFDKSKNKLYITTSQGTPSLITVEYVPIYEDVSEITSDYWIDILMRMSVALTKVVLGRIRTKYRQSGALWDIASDGDKLLQEGNQELEALRETLRVNSQMIYPLD